MREILFRGKRIDDDKWTYGYLFKCWGRCYLLWGMNGDNPIKEEVYPETVGQYTGLTDKNGKYIFEGDLFVPYTYGEKDNDFAGVIEKRGASFVLRSKNYADSRLDDCVEKIFSHYQPNVGEIFVPKNEVAQGEVIDNIHDNPELSEVKK